jgi:hypothetical protein
MSKEYLLELTRWLPEMKIEKQIKVNHCQIYEIAKSNENPRFKRSFMKKLNCCFHWKSSRVSVVVSYFQNTLQLNI